MDELYSDLDSSEADAIAKRRVDQVGEDPGVLFARGAMETLAQTDGVTCVATYTERPPVSSAESSAVCREAVAFAALCLAKVRNSTLELQFKDKPKGAVELHLWSTLQFRLLFKLTTLGLNTLHRRGTSKDTEKFLGDFAATVAANQGLGMKKMLEECVLICAIDLSSKTISPNSEAAKLLVGTFFRVIEVSRSKNVFQNI